MLWAVGLRLLLQLENSPFLWVWKLVMAQEPNKGMGILDPKRALRPFPSPEEAAAGCSPQPTGSTGV